jgi:hypothetical protein
MANHPVAMGLAALVAATISFLFGLATLVLDGCRKTSLSSSPR